MLPESTIKGMIKTEYNTGPTYIWFTVLRYVMYCLLNEIKPVALRMSFGIEFQICAPWYMKEYLNKSFIQTGMYRSFLVDALVLECTELVSLYKSLI